MSYYDTQVYRDRQRRKKRKREKERKEMILSLKIAYWIFFGLFTLVGWASKGIGLGITLAILFVLGYVVMMKLIKLSLNKRKTNGGMKNEI